MNAGLVGPWLALAGLGALHGLNPLGGWPLLACGGRGLVPMAAGHAASLLLVAAAVVLGVDRRWLLLAAALALPVLGLSRRWREAGSGVLAFLASTVHGTGLMLVPALVPLCMAGTPAGEIVASGSWGVVLAAVGVHMAGMLVAGRAAAAVLARISGRGATATVPGLAPAGDSLSLLRQRK